MASKYRRDIEVISTSMGTKVPTLIETAHQKASTKGTILLQILNRPQETARTSAIIEKSQSVTKLH